MAWGAGGDEVFEITGKGGSGRSGALVRFPVQA